MSMTKGMKMLLFAPFAILGLLLFIFLGGQFVQWLWNWLLPPLFGFPQVTFWQALGLLALGRILFGGGGVRFGDSHGARRRVTDRVADRVTDRLVERMGERWDGMTPEERERFRQRMRERFGMDPCTADRKAP